MLEIEGFKTCRNSSKNVSLNSEIEQFIQSQVDSGKYASAEEVILAGIRLLEERERIYKGRFEELRREILKGVEASERGEVVAWLERGA